MHLLPFQEPEGKRTLACAAVIAACFGAAVFFQGEGSNTSVYSAPVLQRTTFSQPMYQAAPRSYSTRTQQLDAVDMTSAPAENLESITLVQANSSIRSLGMASLCMSVVLAAAGLALKAFTYLTAKNQFPLLSPLEVTTLDDVFIAAAAAGKAKGKKAVKGKKVAKAEKPEKVVKVLTPKEAFSRIRRAVLKRDKKPTKTTGRVCQILGKVDNRKARSISFSHRRTKRLQKVNLHWRRLWWEEGKCFVRLRLSTKGIKTVTKYGLHQAALKFGLDLTKHINGTSERKYVKYLPEKEKKFAMLRGADLRYKSAVRWAKLNSLEPPPPLLPRKKDAKKEAEPAEIAMAISHGRKVPKLSKPADQRKALLRSLTTELIRHGRIKTTFVRAKAMRKHVDHMITLAKTNTLHTRRQALGFIYDKDLVKTLFEQVPERYGTREGGYTRIIRTLPRKGDSAKMCYIELV